MKRHRRAIWDNLLSVTGLFHTCGPLCAMWLSGSFLTTKTRPNDIDVVYWMNRHANLHRADLLATASHARPDWHVDAYPLAYAPVADTSGTGGTYPVMRGYWDDLWCRLRDDDPSIARTTRRGYVEVIVDGWHS